MTHSQPRDLLKAVRASSPALLTWHDITPLARNEWICWVISAKQDATRKKRIIRATENLTAGKRRPCCWAGCTHRTS